MDKGFDLNVVTTGDAGKVNHAKPKSRVKDKNVQNVDFLDIVNRLSAKKTEKAQNTPKAQKTQKAQTDSLLSFLIRSVRYLMNTALKT